MTNRIAIVTGAGQGMGRSVAMKLASDGNKILVNDVNAEQAGSTVSKIKALGGEAYSNNADVTSRDEVTNMVDQCLTQYGKVHILVNNAGKPDAKLALRMDPKFVDEMVATNLTSLFHLASEVTRRLIEAELPGRIVNIASGAAYSAGIGTSWYAITKSAVVRMTEMLALEFARYDVNVNCIAPGAFESEMMDGMLERMGDITREFPRKRIGKPSQLDSTLLYLVSPDSDFVTGATIRVHDGQGAR